MTAPAPMVVPGSQMMTAHLVPLAPRTLRGEFHLTTDVTGRAPVSGAVARQLVNVGSRVEAGDRVLEVSSGAISRPVPVAEKRQVRAEREQVDVARGQSLLAQQLSIAQTQLATAQERVALAQQKVSSTRSLVKRLLAGEQIPATGEFAAPVPPRKRARRKRRRLPSEAPVSGDQGLIKDSLTSAKSGLSAAQSGREEAQGAVDSAQKKLDSSKAALEKAQADFKAEKITADVLQSARSDADDAAGALKSAQARAEAADKTLASRQNKLEEAQSLAQKSRDDNHAQAKTDQGAEDAPDETEAPSEKAFLTPTQAATLVAAALRESRAATQSADRMRSRVDDYQQQVKATSQKGESASRDMQIANQEVLDTTPRPVFTSARAPRSGTITWISRLAREVSDGQPVFGMSQSGSGFLRFEDKGNAWKALKVGQTLNAAPAPHLAQPGVTPTLTTVAVTPAPKESPSEAVSLAATNTLSAISPGASVGVFSVRLTRITPPQSDSDAAEVDAVRVDGAGVPDAVDAFQVELPAEAVPQDDAQNGIAATPSRPVVVPASVVLPRDGVNYVAVMEPSQKASMANSLAKSATLSWRPIEIVRQTPFDVEIKSGVRDGEKIVNQPALLLSQWKPEDKKPFPILLDASS